MEILQFRKSLAYITLDRPEVHNAFDDSLIAQLSHALEEIGSRKNLRAVVLGARGKYFSAGADLNWMKRMKDCSFEENFQDGQKLAKMIEGLFSCPIPTIARVHGHAFGGGVGLIAACDFVVALKSAKFAFSEARLGLAPACISRPVIFRLGPSKTRQLFLTGEVFSADRAEKIGLVDQLADHEEELDQKVEGILENLMACSSPAQKACKELTAQMDHLPLKEAMELGAKTIATLRVSPEGQEGLTAFLEKRKPQWAQET